MNKRILFLLLVLSTSMSLAQERELNISYNDWDFKGSLLVPEGAQTCVLIIAGSGPTDRNGNSSLLGGKNNSLKYLAETFDSLGIASLRYDKRGLGDGGTAVKEEDLRFQDYVEDALAWIKHLREEEKFEEIWIAGHSEGALIGLLAATQGRVDGFISLSGPGFPLDQTLREQLKNLPDSLKTPAFTIMDELKAGRTVETVPQMLFALFRPSVQPFLIELFQHEPKALIRQLEIPVLIVQGGRDLQVPTSHGMTLFMAKPNAQYIYLEEMNHVLKAVEDSPLANQMAYVNPGLPLHQGLKKALADYFKP